MIDEMIRFIKTTPQEASNYHRFDMLLSRMERLGMVHSTYQDPEHTWDLEDE